MVRALAIVAAGGLLTCAVCLGAAAAIGGKALAKNDWDFGIFDGDRCSVVPSGRDASRSLDWNGGDTVKVELPANVRYTRGQGEKLVIAGDSAVLPLIRVDDGRIRMACHMHRFDHRLSITLPGRDFRQYDIEGSGRMNLNGIDQPELDIRIAGSGDVTATGHADRLRYSVAGSGDGHFARLAAGRVRVSVAGSGSAEVSPQDRLDVRIAGSGTVVLHREPETMETSIAGSGKIVHADGSTVSAHGLTHSED